MEFEEMQKIWDTQRQQTLYAIDEAALYRRITAKAKKADRWLNMNEIGLTIISVVTGSILLGDAYLDQENWWDFATGILFFLIAGFILLRRRKRLRTEPRFADSLRGELESALTRNEQLIRLNRGFQYWFLLPITVLVLSGMIWRGEPWSMVLLITGMFALAWVLVRWELRAKFLPRQRELDQLRTLLAEESAEPELG